MKINKEWHLANRMPRNPTPQQRLTWHLEHEKNCSCRKMPASMRAELEKNLKLPPL